MSGLDCKEHGHKFCTHPSHELAALRAERDALQAQRDEAREEIFRLRTERSKATEAWKEWHEKAQAAAASLKAEQTAHAATRAEVERMKAALAEPRRDPEVEMQVVPSAPERIRAALDSSAPAPRTFTEEQVLAVVEATKAAIARYADEESEHARRLVESFRIDLKALMEVKP